ncbi:MAG: ABC transporter permease [Paludibacteraceae bacterium]|nr:ABC transporter permease [Paludibacteraceae bacterium]
MRIELHIAWRYIFSKKSHNAINIVSGVSAAAVGVVTAAMVCVLSVMNGFGTLIEGMFSQFDPELRIIAAEGKSFSVDNESIQEVLSLPSVAAVSQIVEETALISYKGHQMPAHLVGVDNQFAAITRIDSIITDGYFSVFDGAFERAVLGRGLAGQIGINAHFVGGLHIYAPKRNGRVNMLRPDESFNEATAFIAGTFAVNQVQYDESYMLVSLPLARALFEYDSLTVTAIHMQLTEKTLVKPAQKQIQRILGNRYVVQNRYEQQADFFRILKVEKLLTALLLAFIMLIACFNIISSLSMLIIDKKEDIKTLRNIGADNAMIQRIFLYEGWLTSTLGAIIGLGIGLAACLAQEHWGFLKLGSGTEYIISTYPVHVQAIDIIIIGVTVIVLGFVAAWYPVRKLKVEEV